MQPPLIEPRVAAELVELGRALAESYCSGWSSWDRDDAGLAFLAAIAGAQEQVFERVNRFPDKVFIELLRILGLQLRMPTAARALLQCDPVPGLDGGRWVPRRTTVQAEGAPGEAPIRFSTEEELLVSATRLTRIVSRAGPLYRELSSDFLPQIQAKTRGIAPFEELRPMPRYLYLSDPCLHALAGSASLEVRLESDDPLPVAVRDAVVWQYFDGLEWRRLPGVPVRDALFLRADAFSELESGEELRLFIFSGLEIGDVRDYLLWEYRSSEDDRWQPLQAEPFESSFWPGEQGVVLKGPVDDLGASAEFGSSRPGVWLRTRLDTVPSAPHAPPLYRVATGVAAQPAPIRQVYRGPADGAGETKKLKHSKPFKPFGKAPKIEMACYIDLAGLDQPRGRVRLDIELELKAGGRPSPDCVLVWEYFDGMAWLPLGRSTRFGISGSYQPHFFIDETRALSRSGSVGFARPPDMIACSVEDAFGCWVRVRMRSGQYGDGYPRIISLRCLADHVPADIQQAVVVRNAIATDISAAVARARPEPWPPQLGELKTLFAFAGPLELARPGSTLPEITLDCNGEELREVFIRARLPRVSKQLDVQRVLMRSQSGWEGRMPDGVLTSSNGEFFDEPGPGEPFAPFGVDPKPGAVLYVCVGPQAEPGARLTLRFELRRPAHARVQADLRLSWESYDGEEWGAIARMEVGWFKGGVDTTEMLTRPGRVELTLPETVRSVSMRGRGGCWVRVRLTAGGYQHPPAFEALRLDCIPPQRPVREVVLGRRLAHERFGERLREGTALPLLEAFPSDEPALEMALWPTPQPERFQLYAQVEERLEEQAEARSADYFARRARRAPQGRARQPVWEYLAADGFRPLQPRDDSEFLRKSGMLSCIPDADWQPQWRYGTRACWLRLRIPRGQLAKLPPQLHYLVNSVPASHCEQVEDEVLGGGSGDAFENFRLLKTPVLGALRLKVREPGPLHPLERQKLELKAPGEAVREIRDEEGELQGYWILWQEVSSFIESGPRDRHFTLDRLHGLVQFGNGQRGRMPPRGQDTVVAEYYRSGGGAVGNVGVGEIREPERALPGLDAIRNPLAAVGGSNLGDLAEVRVRGPELLRNRERAVSCEDFGWLVQLAFPLVSRVLCRTRGGVSGLIDVSVLPRVEGIGEDRAAEPWHAPVELLKDVRTFLHKRCQPGFQISVSGPRFVSFDLRAVVVLRPGEGDREARARIAAAARAWFDPYTGGPEGKGWPFGREVKAVEVLRALRSLPEVLAIYGGDLIDRKRGRKLQRIELADDQLARLVDVEVASA